MACLASSGHIDISPVLACLALPAHTGLYNLGGGFNVHYLSNSLYLIQFLKHMNIGLMGEWLVILNVVYLYPAR